jgi:hypothetical protein
MTAPVAARTNQWGARTYPIPVPGEDQVRDLPAVSQVLRVLDAPGLNIWKQKLIAEQLALRPDLLLLASDPATRWNAIQQALDSSKSAANTGTAIHRFTELVDNDTLDWDLVPEAAKPWVSQYAEAKARYGWEMVYKEVTVFNHAMGYAGTTDGYLKIPGYGVVVADTKTGSNIYADQALQLSFYANAEGIWTSPADTELTEYLSAQAQLDEDSANGENIPEGRRKWSAEAIKVAQAEINETKWREYARKGSFSPMPADLRTDVGFILHLGPDKCELVPMNLDGAKDVIRGMCNVYWWKQRKDIVQKPLSGDVERTVDSLREIEASLRNEPAPATAEQPIIEEAKVTPIVTLDEEPLPLSSRIASMRSRISALSPEAKGELVFRWPSGVPTFKQSQDHTEEQVQQIEDELWAVECKFMPPATTELERKVQLVADAFPGAAVYEEPEEPF